MLKRVQKIIQALMEVLQRILITMVLAILYVIGFGLTSLFLRIFKRSFFSEKCEVKNTCWRDASGYEAGRDDHLRQA